MASIGDFAVKKPHFYEFWPSWVNVVTMKPLNAVYLKVYDMRILLIYNSIL